MQGKKEAISMTCFIRTAPINQPKITFFIIITVGIFNITMYPKWTNWIMMCLPYIQMNMLALDLGLLSLVICLTPCCSCMDRPIKHTGRVAAFIYIYTWTLQNCDLTEHHFIESMIHALQIASITTYKAYNDTKRKLSKEYIQF